MIFAIDHSQSSMLARCRILMPDSTPEPPLGPCSHTPSLYTVHFKASLPVPPARSPSPTLTPTACT